LEDQGGQKYDQENTSWLRRHAVHDGRNPACLAACKRFEAEKTGVTILDLDRLTRAGLAQGKAIPDTMFRVNLVRDRFEEAISAFESTCAAEGIKYQVKQEEKEISFDLMISLARYHDLMIFGLRSIFQYNISIQNLSIEEPKDTLARVTSAGVRPIIAVWQADMIVLGNSARNLLMKRVLGETAWHIIRNSDRPLFLCQ
jgi:hypothetical protein